MCDTNAMLCPLLGLSTVQVAAMSKPDVIPVPPNLPVQTHAHTNACMPADPQSEAESACFVAALLLQCHVVVVLLGFAVMSK